MATIRLPGRRSKGDVVNLSADERVVNVSCQTELRIERRGRARIDVIEGVERIYSELSGYTFSDLHRLTKGEIDIPS